MRRLIARLLLFALLLTPTAWTLLTNPLAWPVLMRGTEGITARIEVQMARAVSDGTLNERLAEAVARKDALATEALLDIAVERDALPPDPLLTEAETLIGKHDGVLATAASCAVCAAEIRNCRSVSQIASCNLPVEFSPLGDANALRRQATNALTGAEVDSVEAGLAVVGLAATAVVVVTGGSSTTVKAGASVGRVARRMGAISPALVRNLRKVADLDIKWGLVDDYLLDNAELAEVVDTAKLERLTRIASDFGDLRQNTSISDSLVLLRQVDTGAELALLVRVSSAVGKKTKSAFALLGKSRVFRALDEVALLTRWGLALIGAVLMQMAAMMAGLVMRRVRRRLRKYAA